MKPHWSLILLLAAFGGYVWSFGFNSGSFSMGAIIGPAVLIVPALLVSRRLALTCGFLFGVAFHAASLSWVFTVMRVHGHLEAIPAAGVLALMVAYLAVYPGLFSLALAVQARRGEGRALLTAPFLWIALEFAQTHAPIFGFPWNLAGYVAAKSPALIQLASVTGIYGLSFFMVACGSLFVWVLPSPEQPKWQSSRMAIGLGAALIFVIVALAGGRYLPPLKSDRAAVLVQLNFPQAPTYPTNWMDIHAGEMDKLEQLSVDAVQRGLISSYEEPPNSWITNVPSKFIESGKHLEANEAPRAGLIIWPEVPAPFYFLDPKFAARAERIARDSGAHFLVGVVEWRPGAEKRWLPYNSAVLLDASGKRVFQYDKIHLVPFGEYVPLRRWLKFAESLVAEVGDFRAGTQYATGELPDEPAPWEMRTPGPPHKFGVSICYEAIFPNEVRQFVANGAELLINISNDGWLGRSAGPDQHLTMARVRAVENRRWLLRATNNGYTVAIDPYGRIVAHLATDVRGVLRAPFSFRSDRTIYSRFGDWFAWMCVIVAIGFLLMGIGKAESKDTGGQEVGR